MNEKLLAVLVAGILLLMFSIVHVVAIVRTVRAPPDPPAHGAEDALNESATMLSGLVVGVVTLVFGLPKAANVLGVELLTALKYSYVIVYFIIGFASWAVWVFRSGNILLPVRNLALSFVGVALAIAALVFDEQRQEPNTSESSLRSLQ